VVIVIIDANVPENCGGTNASGAYSTGLKALILSIAVDVPILPATKAPPAAEFQKHVYSHKLTFYHLSIELGAPGS
jgi:hypothetical protein